MGYLYLHPSYSSVDGSARNTQDDQGSDFFQGPADTFYCFQPLALPVCTNFSLGQTGVSKPVIHRFMWLSQLNSW